MSIFNHIHKHIVAAIAAIVMFTLPSGAQQADIDDLFAQMQVAPAEDSSRIADQIITLWSSSGSASMDLLLKRGEDALAAGDVQAAIDHFSALVDHAPDFAESYHARARAYFEAGYFGPAMVDLRAALALNPRHFAVMTGLAFILESTDKPQAALEIYRAVLDLTPHDEDVLKAVSRLEGVAL